MRMLLATVCLALCFATYSHSMKKDVIIDLSCSKSDIGKKSRDFFQDISTEYEHIDSRNVTTIMINNRSDISHEELARYFLEASCIKPHTNITEIYLNGTKVNEKVLENMTIAYTVFDIKAKSLSCFALSAKYLDISETDITDESLALIGKWKSIETLRMKSTKVNLLNKEIANLSSLKFLDLQYTPITKEAARNIPQTLQALNIRGCKSLSPSDFSFLSDFIKIEFLDVSETVFSDAKMLPQNLKELECQDMLGDVINAYYFPITIMSINGMKLPSSAHYLGEKLKQMEIVLKKAKAKIEIVSKQDQPALDTNPAVSTKVQEPAEHKPEDSSTGATNQT